MVSSLGAKCVLVGCLAGLLAGCTASGDQVRPPRDKLFFPTALEVSPDESKLFVVSSNSNLEHDSGSVSVLDLDTVDALIQDWLDRGEAGQGCERDALRPGLLRCDEALAIAPEAGVRIGNFATGLGVQTLASGDLRLFVTVRGDPSVTWIDYRNGELVCEGSEAVPLCDTPNRLTSILNDLELPALVDEPFEVYVDSASEYAVVTHLARAAVSLIDAPADGSAPQMVDAVTGLFAGRTNVAPSAVGVAGRMAGEELIYVTSRSENRVSLLSVLRREGRATALVPSDYFFLNSVEPSHDARGIAFDANGARAYVVGREPPMLHVYDTRLDGDGFPRNRIAGTVELCREPSNVVVADMGRGPRAYVTCFSAGQVWAVNPDLMTVEAILDVGRGPHALSVAPERKRLYVGNFLESTVAVVDLSPGVETENRLVLRLGRSGQGRGN